MSQNGSTSMAATCSSCLALMDAGVPLKRPVSGVAMGLMVDVPKGQVITEEDIDKINNSDDAISEEVTEAETEAEEEIKESEESESIDE